MSEEREYTRQETYYLGWATNIPYSALTLQTRQISYKYVIRHITISVQGYGNNSWVYELLVTNRKYDKFQLAKGKQIIKGKYIFGTLGDQLKEANGIVGYQDGAYANIGDVNHPYDIWPDFIVDFTPSYITLTMKCYQANGYPAHVDVFFDIEEIGKTWKLPKPIVVPPPKPVQPPIYIGY